MPAIEDETGGAGRSGPARDFSTPPITPRPLPLPDTSRTPARDSSSRFDTSRLTKLAPFTMPVPERVVEPTPAEGVRPWGSSYAQPQGAHAPDDARGAWQLYGHTEQDQKDAKTAEPVPTEEPKPRTKRSYELTWEEYNKLSDEKRAAVDFNTMLVQARQKDLKAGYTKVTPQERERYNTAVAKMFGEDGGSETFAPETVAMLQRAGFKDKSEDLDNFLGLKAAITANELKDFTTETAKMDLAIPAGLSALTGTDEVTLTAAPTAEQGAATGTTKLIETIAKGNEMLQTFKASAVADRAPLAELLGGTASKPHLGVGYGELPAEGEPNNINSFFQWAYAGLANKEFDPAVVWTAVDETLKPDEKTALMQYLDAQSREAKLAGRSLIDSKSSRQPDELRKLLGLDGTGD